MSHPVNSFVDIVYPTIPRFKVLIGGFVSIVFFFFF